MFAEDLAAFFDTEAFAESATLTIGGTPAAVSVIFDAAYIDPLGSFEGTAPRAWIPSADASGVAQGDTLNVRSTTYTVVEVMPDGTGRVVELRLRT